MKMKENQNNYIYIVLVKALTGLGKFARLTGKYEYTHIAVCLDEKFDKIVCPIPKSAMELNLTQHQFEGNL